MNFIDYVFFQYLFQFIYNILFLGVFLEGLTLCLNYNIILNLIFKHLSHNSIRIVSSISHIQSYIFRTPIYFIYIISIYYTIIIYPLSPYQFHYNKLTKLSKFSTKMKDIYLQRCIPA